MQVFPMVQRYANELKQAAQAVCDHTDREDLRTMASMYSNNLDSEMRRTGRYDLTARATVARNTSASDKVPIWALSVSVLAKVWESPYALPTLFADARLTIVTLLELMSCMAAARYNQL